VRVDRRAKVVWARVSRASGGSSGREEGGSKASSWRVAGLSLLVLCLAVYLPGLWTIPPVDRDECRFAQASRQMFEGGGLAG